MTINRRSFITSAAAMGLAAASPLVCGAPRKNVLSSRPNPRMDHLSESHASRLCEGRDENAPCHMLDLREFRTVAPAALALLAAKSWTWLDLGIANVSDEVALSLSKIPVSHITLHHVEQISPMALAILAVSPGVDFEQVVAIDPVGIEDVAALMGGMADPSWGHIQLDGPYRVDLALAKALAQLPCGLCLEPDLGEPAFEAGCADALSWHRGPTLGTFQALLPSREWGGRYSIPFVEALSGNARKRVQTYGEEGPSVSGVELNDV